MNYLCQRLFPKLKDVTLITISQRLFSGGLITGDEEGQSTELPHNLIILGVDREKIEKRKQRKVVPVPDNCKLIRSAKDCPRHRTPSRICLDSFESIDYTPNEAVELHPEVFTCQPRIDFLHLCKEWQMKYREVDYRWAPTRGEMGRGRAKPWAQKGSGRARHGSTVAPQWIGGGVAQGPRGPKASYQKIPMRVRLKALTSALSVKYFQQDLTILKNMNISAPEQDHFCSILSARDMVENSVLLVYSDDDQLQESDNISKAVGRWPEVNLMPLVGLNMWSLLHHDKLVLTLQALEELETKVTWNLHRYDWIDKPHNFYRDLPFKMM